MKTNLKLFMFSVMLSTPDLELHIVFRYHRPNDPWLCKMMGQFSEGWVNDNLKCTHLQY